MQFIDTTIYILLEIYSKEFGWWTMVKNDREIVFLLSSRYLFASDKLRWIDGQVSEFPMKISVIINRIDSPTYTRSDQKLRNRYTVVSIYERSIFISPEISLVG